LAVSALCACHGVEIVRVHDVAANRKVVDLVRAIEGS
jgi:dihydropteroate synthase